MLHTELFAGSLHGLHGGSMGRRRRIPENANPHCVRHGFFKDFQLLRDEVGEKH